MTHPEQSEGGKETAIKKGSKNVLNARRKGHFYQTQETITKGCDVCNPHIPAGYRFQSLLIKILRASG